MDTAVTATVMETESRNTARWYPVRVTYSRELKVREVLQSLGYECFVPMTLKTVEKNGVKICRTVPAVNNLCFVKGVRNSLDEEFERNGLRSFTSYIWDRSTREPVVVPDKAMDDFIKISESRYEDIVYLHEVNSKLREGRMVRVKCGPFTGIVGRVVRVKRSRRVMVELPGLFAVATGYIPEEELELI